MVQVVEERDRIAGFHRARFDGLLDHVTRIEAEAKADVCPRCHGDGWLKSNAHLGQKGFGNMYPCSCVDALPGEGGLLEGQAKRAGIPHAGTEAKPFTWDNYDLRDGIAGMLEGAKAFALGDGPPFLVLVADTGMGKTHLLSAIGRQCLERGLTVHYEVAAEMVDRLRHSHKEGMARDLFELMNELVAWDVLLLDDLGMERPTPLAYESLTRVVDRRLNDWKRTVIATNQSKAETEESLGPRLASRLYNRNTRLGEVNLVVCTVEQDFRDQAPGKKGVR